MPLLTSRLIPVSTPLNAIIATPTASVHARAASATRDKPRPRKRREYNVLLVTIVLAMLLTASGWLVLKAPAPLALAFLRDRIDPLTVHGVQGSLWNGTAERTWWGDTAMGGMRWQLDRSNALGGVLLAKLHFELPKNQLLSARIRQQGKLLQIDSLQAQLLGSALQRFFTAQQLHPIGTLQIDVERALFDDGIPLSVRGRAIWRQATLTGPRVPIFLGDLRVDFRGDQPGLVTGAITDLGGPVQLAGWMRLDAAGYRIHMQFSARDPRLDSSLGQFGEASGEASRAIDLRAIWWWKSGRG